MRISAADLRDSLTKGSVLPYRVLLAVASTLYTVFITMALVWPPTWHHCPSVTSYVLNSGWAYGWAMCFGTNAMGLWWRIFDDSPQHGKGKRAWAIAINISSVALWGSMTVASAMMSSVIAPGIVGYMIIDLMAVQALWRTEFTWRDRVTL